MSRQPNTLQKALALLDRTGRRQIAGVILVSCAAALSTALMVASLVPFLTVLANPTMVRESGLLSQAKQLLRADSPLELLTWLGLISIGLLVISAAIRILNVFVIARFTAGQKRELQRNLLHHYFNRPYVFHLERNSSELAANLLTEVNEAFRLVFQPAAQLANSLLMTIAIIAVLLTVNVGVTVAALVIIGGAYAGIYALARSHIRRLGGIRAEATKRLYQSASEGLQGIKEIKVLGRVSHYLQRFDRASMDERSATLKLRVLVDVPKFFIQTSILIAVIVFCLIFVSEEMLANAEAAGSLVPVVGVFAAAGQRLIPELQVIYGSLSTIRFGASAVDRLYSDLATSSSPLPTPDQAPIRLKRELCLTGISFAYLDSNSAILKNVSAAIRAGERIGIAGHSGAGKSTLADIVLGLLAPTSGKLTADGTPIDAENVEGWQKSIGLVPQEIFLADTTLLENIALGLDVKDINVDRVHACIDIAQAAEFVNDLPDGLETVIGERGVRLSGGQRQRIAIARSFFKGVDLLVFDEATSALDSLTEQDVMSAIAALPDEITLILVAHRMTTLDICDRIIVMEKGSIAGIGTKAELSTSCDVYRRLVAGSAETAARGN